MSYRSSNPQVGDIVYKAFTPSQCGKVVSVSEIIPYPYFAKVTVRLLNGKEITHSANMFSDFEELVLSHKRKYENQNAQLKRIRNDL